MMNRKNFTLNMLLLLGITFTAPSAASASNLQEYRSGNCQASSNVTAEQQKSTPPLQNGLFQLNEIDLHVHAGKEKPMPLNQWVDYLVRDGRKVLLLLDHLELYRMEEKEKNDWLTKSKLNDWYPDLINGKYLVMNDLRNISESRKDVLIFRGWEIWEGELDEGLEKQPMKEAEVIGWHISKAAWDGKVPKGKELIVRAKQVIEVQKEFPVPMILFHPFNGHYHAVKDAALKSGRQAASIKKEEYRYFTTSEQQELIGLLKGSSIYLEIEMVWLELWKDPVAREAFTDDIRPLTEAGLKFTVSTDAHHERHLSKPYQPEVYCSQLGVTPENVNSLIRELLAIRAKKRL